MPAVQEKLTAEQFHSRYDGEKPHWEFWDGEPVQKAMPTWLHSLIQKILLNLLDGLGYESGVEVRLRLDPNYEPVPDVIAVEGAVVGAYPEQPFAVVVEILSPADSFSRVLRKCRLYERWGIERIAVVDPETRLIWSFENGVPVETDTIATRGDRTVTAGELWAEVDRRSAHLSV